MIRCNLPQTLAQTMPLIAKHTMDWFIVNVGLAGARASGLRNLDRDARIYSGQSPESAGGCVHNDHPFWPLLSPLR
ncbi:MAG: hypothetical protein LBK95_18770 [Bifidobacteriaceae bacterium]|jgi:hypothetical protein|nr:hypothetical protein [Bifidobacteriaceae bacterium]